MEMNNRAKQAIKSIPGISSAAKTLNRTLFHRLREVKSRPVQKKRNDELNGSIKALAALKRKRIWYFGVPEHPNLGDQAQRVCIERWLNKSFPDYEIVPIPSAAFNGSPNRTCETIGECMDRDDFMVMQSGHTMDGLHPDEQAHRFVSLRFPENRIVFFPTSISFASARGKALDVDAINSHERTLFLARDGVSKEIAQEIYPNVAVRCLPDVVTMLIGEYDCGGSRDGVLLCTRNDGEKYYSYRDIDRLAHRLNRYFAKVDQSDTAIDPGMLDGTLSVIWDAIQRTVSGYSRYSVIVTDRYHGTIFARIAETPVVVLRTTDHKVVSGAEWFVEGGDEGILVADTLEQSVELARQLARQFPDGVAAPKIGDTAFAGLRDEIMSV